MRVNYTCPACGDDHEDTVALFYEGGWSWEGGIQPGETHECGAVATPEHCATMREIIIDTIAHSGEPITD